MKINNTGKIIVIQCLYNDAKGPKKVEACCTTFIGVMIYTVDPKFLDVVDQKIILSNDGRLRSTCRCDEKFFDDVLRFIEFYRGSIIAMPDSTPGCVFGCLGRKLGLRYKIMHQKYYDKIILNNVIYESTGVHHEKIDITKVFV